MIEEDGEPHFSKLPFLKYVHGLCILRYGSRKEGFSLQNLSINDTLYVK